MTHTGDPSNNPQPPAPGTSAEGHRLPGQGAPAPAPLPQQPPQQQGFHRGAQPGGFGPEGTIAFTLQGSVLTSNMLTPKVFIDGYPVPASYGLNRLPVPAGRHIVSAEATWIVKYGQASYEVDVPPGQTVPVFYAAPMVQFMKGRMGSTKQQRPGLWVFLVLILVIIVIVVLAVVAGS